MPRLTHPTYYAHYRFLNRVWVESRQSWKELVAGEQWDLHNFYTPRRLLSEDELKEHRQKVVASDPTLPQRAGRAFRKIEAAYAMHVLAAREWAAHPVAVEPVKESDSRRIG